MDIDYNMPVGNMQTFYERKLSKFLIMFDNSNLLYFPGQFLSGRVIVELQDEMAITGKYLVFISETRSVFANDKFVKLMQDVTRDKAQKDI